MTLHLPGQVVVYPVLDLKKRGRDLHGLMRQMEEAIILTLADFRMEAMRVPGKTGVWVEDRKIASLGIAVKNWVSYHGLAVNVDCDLKEFQKIEPCGFSPNVMTSVKKEMSEGYKKVWDVDARPLVRNIKERLIENLKECLSVDAMKVSFVKEVQGGD